VGRKRKNFAFFSKGPKQMNSNMNWIRTNKKNALAWLQQTSCHLFYFR
jgi:hypothetical protein